MKHFRFSDKLAYVIQTSPLQWQSLKIHPLTVTVLAPPNLCLCYVIKCICVERQYSCSYTFRFPCREGIIVDMEICTNLKVKDDFGGVPVLVARARLGVLAAAPHDGELLPGDGHMSGAPVDEGESRVRHVLLQRHLGTLLKHCHIKMAEKTSNFASSFTWPDCGKATLVLFCRLQLSVRESII